MRALEDQRQREAARLEDEVAAALGALAAALAAARALIEMDELNAEAVARKAMAIAADICVYTNSALVVEKIPE